MSRTPDITEATLVDDLIGNRDNSTRRIPFQNLAQQLAGSGAVADRLNDMAAALIGGVSAYANTVAELPSGTADQLAWVTNDGAASGFYEHDGSDWQKVADSPFSLARIDGIEDRLATLEIVTVDSLTVDPSDPQELGTSVTPDLSWEIGGTGEADSLTVNGASITATDTDWTAGSAITETTTYTVEVTYNTDQTHSDSVTVTFQPRVFWGASSSATLDSAAIIALGDSELRGNHNIDQTVSTTAEYVYVCFPTSFGAYSTYALYGFTETPTVTTVSVTTAAGHTEDYYVLRSPNTLTGSVPVEVS